MVDSYLWGNVDRISPEAPVPVVALQRRENRLGGAANVALNIQSLGAIPILCSVIGDDIQGSIFKELLQINGIETSGILTSADRTTTTKYRIFGNKAQMLRVDEEITTPVSPKDEADILSIINNIIHTSKPDVVIFQDYNKGVLTASLIDKVIAECNSNNIPCCTDPKKSNFNAFRNISLFKPNLKELKEGLKIEIEPTDLIGIDNAIRKFQEIQNIELFMLTLSEHGVLIREKEQKETIEVIPAHKRVIADVSGAGDTVISVAALCLASGCSPVEIASISNLAGGLVCEEPGVVPVNHQKLLAEVCKLL